MVHPRQHLRQIHRQIRSVPQDVFAQQMVKAHSTHSGQHRRQMQVLNETLKLHNWHRARHCVPPLIISRTLNEIAQSYANYLAATSTFEHSGNKLGKESLGENLYMQWISDGRVKVSGAAATKNWYDEISLYDYNNPTYSEQTGHFTQMVWKDTKKMGVGVALSPDGREVYIVANYYPAGNIINPGHFARNVLRPSC
ncbi:unnamed protein product [Didymodactylos carnosus]|uniref:SCP domain-containing protein n=1 Tax=Didymodactylos carnosus TaxID=1234261 RepID=A0A814IUV7_9BILA|nr:unnamed protein product [Didymodactylos carnosus]CAF1396452.1 unnamed protein product [Didymodactylos carnosus]CAF3798570.1 unnamed protein product [Didymodactylos carnosus]CAF4203933.1 unnamed protein product [Didymodactylos carnosus]